MKYGIQTVEQDGSSKKYYWTERLTRVLSNKKTLARGLPNLQKQRKITIPWNQNKKKKHKKKWKAIEIKATHGDAPSQKGWWVHAGSGRLVFIGTQQ